MAPGERFSVALEQRIAALAHLLAEPGRLGPGHQPPVDAASRRAGRRDRVADALGAAHWPLVNYGYEGQVGLLVQLSVPADAKAGSRFTATGRALAGARTSASPSR